MFLTRLVAFADSCDALPPEFHAWRNIRWMLDLRPDGEPDGNLVDLAVPDEPARSSGKLEIIPNLQRSGAGFLPRLACDDVKNALGWTEPVADGRTVPAKESERARRCHAAFTELVAAWAQQQPQHRGAHALLTFLRGSGPQRLPRPAKYSAGDLVAFRMDNEFIHLTPGARGYWATVAAQRKISGTGLCLVCEKSGPLIETYPRQVTAGLIPTAGFDPDSRRKNRPQPSSVALASVNRDSMRFDLDKKLIHSPICVRCAEASVAALERMLRSRDHTRRVGDTALTWWLLDTDPTIQAPIRLVFEPDDAEIDALLAETPTADEPDRRQLVKTVGAMLDSPKAGQESSQVDTGAFCAATLSANKTRLILRDWIDVPLPAAKRAVKKWFTDLSVLDPWTQRPARHSLHTLALATGRWDRQRNLYCPFGDSSAQRPLSAQRNLLTAALHAVPLPHTFAQHLVQRLRADHRLDNPRLALLTLLLTRTFRVERTNTMSLDDTHTAPAYLSGRLFAVIEDLQNAATRLDNNGKKLNTTITDRYLTAASTSPARVMPDLLRGTQAHLKKLRSRNKDGLANHYANQRDDLTERIQPMPMTLTLPEQCQWFAGYAHQRNHFRALAAARRQQKENEPTNDTQTTTDPTPTN